MSGAEKDARHDGLIAVQQLEQAGDWNGVFGYIDCPYAEVRAYVVSRVRRRGGSDAAPVLTRRLTVEEDAEVRGGIALALASFEDPALTGTLAALLDDPSEGVRRIALRGLSKLDDPRVLEVAPILYSSGGWLARQEALDALARLGTPEAEAALETLLTAERRWRGRRAIRKALRRCGEGWEG